MSDLNIRVHGDSQLLVHIDMTLEDGSAADSTRVENKPTLVQLGNQSISSAFEQQLIGHKAGDTITFTLDPEDAFGQRRPDNIHYVDKSKFGSEVPAEIGAIVTFTQPGGVELPGVIREVTGQSVTVDFNHPLAGQAITFKVEILEIRR